MSDDLPKETSVCKCPSEDWPFGVNGICSGFVADQEGRCINCEHNKECHERT